MLREPDDNTPQQTKGFDLIYRDSCLLVLNKPTDLLSVPGRGEHKQDCLASRVQVAYPEALSVHRLDMSTSGVLIMARGPEVQRYLQGLFEQRQVEKTYIAVVAGHLQAERGEINLPLINDWPNRPRQKVDHAQGKPALTRYRVMEYQPQSNCSRVELQPVTGRSHQLRVHMQALGHAIWGDPLYAPEPVRANSARLLLHAASIRFAHPATGELVRFQCDVPF